MNKPIYAVATLDTKANEIKYVVDLIRRAGWPCLVVDSGSGEHNHGILRADITRDQVLACHPDQDSVAAALSSSDKGMIVNMMSDALKVFFRKISQSVAGVISIGGSGGTALAIPCMHELPLGIPKVMVSTMASGDVGPYVLGSDITMMYSVADVAGINVISSEVLGNAAHAIAGMAKFRSNIQEQLKADDVAPFDERSSVGMSMFGVTTPCCDQIRANLEERKSKNIDAICFHSTGSGGRAMNQLIQQQKLKGVIDITITELCDELFGGVLSAGKDRFDYLETANQGQGIPTVMSLGACDMINFGAYDTVPYKYRSENGRTTYKHGKSMTLVRTTPEENKTMGVFLAKKINKSKQPFVLLLPEKGVSIIDTPGMPFHNEEADEVLFDTLEKAVNQNDNRIIVRVPYSINDPEFAKIATLMFIAVMERATVGKRVSSVEKAVLEKIKANRASIVVTPKKEDLESIDAYNDEVARAAMAENEAARAALNMASIAQAAIANNISPAEAAEIAKVGQQQLRIHQANKEQQQKRQSHIQRGGDVDSDEEDEDAYRLRVYGTVKSNEESTTGGENSDEEDEESTIEPSSSRSTSFKSSTSFKIHENDNTGAPSVSPEPAKIEPVPPESVKRLSRSESVAPPLPRFVPAKVPGPRDTILPKLLDLINDGVPIIGAGAGSGISARFEAAGGADLIIVYNSGRFRMAGHGSLAGLLPFKDANAVMLEMGNEILPITKKTNTPLLAGVCATDPFRDMDRLLKQCQDMGFAGVQNFPTVGLMDGTFRENLEQTGMGYDNEVEMIRIAKEKYGLLTTPYCFNEEEAMKMARVGADIIVAHLGLTTGGSIGSENTATLEESVQTIQRIADAARSVNPNVIVLCHGGPIAMPSDTEYVLQNTSGVYGFYGASSMERLPVELAITNQMKKFKSIML